MPSSSITEHGRIPRPTSMRSINLRVRTSSQQVRRKFFHKIGIDATYGLHRKSQNSSESERRSYRDLRRVPRFDEPLQYDRQEEKRREELHQSRQQLLSSSPVAVADEDGLALGPKKRVGFQESVTVVPIPMRTEYSARVRNKLYSDSVEMYENVERNIVEFASENGDWRGVRLEEEMYVCGVTGNLIHPAHVEANRYVFGNPDFGATSAGAGACLSQERRRYWNDRDAI